VISETRWESRVDKIQGRKGMFPEKTTQGVWKLRRKRGPKGNTLKKNITSPRDIHMGVAKFIKTRGKKNVAFMVQPMGKYVIYLGGKAKPDSDWGGGTGMKRGIAIRLYQEKGRRIQNLRVGKARPLHKIEIYIGINVYKTGETGGKSEKSMSKNGKMTQKHHQRGKGKENMIQKKGGGASRGHSRVCRGGKA